MPLQWRNQLWQSFEEGAGKRCSECVADAEVRVKHSHYKHQFRSPFSKGVVINVGSLSVALLV